MLLIGDVKSNGKAIERFDEINWFFDKLFYIWVDDFSLTLNYGVYLHGWKRRFRV